MYLSLLVPHSACRGSDGAAAAAAGHPERERERLAISDWPLLTEAFTRLDEIMKLLLNIKRLNMEGSVNISFSSSTSSDKEEVMRVLSFISFSISAHVETVKTHFSEEAV